jgi:hypothetical protein
VAALRRAELGASPRVEDLARIPRSFPTCTNVFARAMVGAARQLHEGGIWRAEDPVRPAQA